MSKVSNRRSGVKAYVQDVQGAVSTHRASCPQIAEVLTEAKDRVRGILPDVDQGAFAWKVKSDVPEEMGIRTTRSTPTQVTIELPESVDEAADRIELYQTATDVDGITQTALLGTARYADSDGRWRVQFRSGPFGSREPGNLVLHAHVLGIDGALQAIDASCLVD
jgi:hypothetical protein